MLPPLPDAYPDEIFCGILGRYQLRNGYTSYKSTQEDLFGTRSAVTSVYFPSRLSALCTNLPYSDEHRFIQNNTMFPLFQPFLPQSRCDKIIGAMKGNNGGGIHASIGLAAGGVAGSDGRLRYCPHCIQEDDEKYGEPYWHRVHQAPGVFVCPEHKVFLEEYCPTCKEPLRLHGKQELLLPPIKCHSGDDLVCNGRIVDLENVVHMHMYNYALDVEALIRCSSYTTSYTEIFNQYVNLLQAKDIATPSGRVRQKDLYQSFKAFYGKEFPELMDSPVDYVNYNWLAVITRKPQRLVHPTRHILIMRFLAGSVNNFFDCLVGKKYYGPFGEGPWPCLNQVADHFKTPVIMECKITKDSKTRVSVGTFSCSCGFVYSRRGPDNSEEDKYKIGRIKSFGLHWENKLRNLLDSGIYSFREIARIMKADTNTIIRYYRLLGYSIEKNNIKVNSHIAEDIDIERKEICRQKILSIVKYNKNISRKMIKQQAYKELTWLYRHDKKWLNSVLPSPTPRKKRNKQLSNRVDWKERDVEINTLVKKVSLELINKEGKPVRLTLGQIGRRIDKLTLLEHYLDKLPRTKRTLLKVVETVEEFQIRRVKWAAQELFENNQDVVEWKVVRKAGLRPGFGDKVLATINDELKRYSVME